MKLATYLISLLFGLSVSAGVIESTQIEQSKDTSNVFELIEKYESLKYDQPGEAFASLEKALSLALELNFDRGIIESQLVLGIAFEGQGNYDTSLYFINNALERSESIDYQKGIIQALLGKGNTLRSISKWDEALAPLLKASDLAEQAQDTNALAKCYNLIGNIYSDQHQFEPSLNYYQKSAVLLSDQRTKAVVLLNMGLIHYRLNNMDKAMSYYSESLEIAQLLEEKLIIAHVYQKIGFIKRDNDQYEEARQHYNLALEQFKAINNQSAVASLYSNIGNIHVDLKEFQQAIKQYKLALEIQRAIDDKVSQCYTLVGIGSSYGYISQYKIAEKYLLEARTLSSEIGVQLSQRDAAMRLSEIYADQKNYKEAYYYQVELKQLDDSIFNETKSAQIEEMEAQFQNDQKEKEISLLNAENQIAYLKLSQEESVRNYIIVIACIILTLLFVLYKQYQTKAKANTKLKELDQLKTDFFTNISHELRTPLSLIISPAQQLLEGSNSNEQKDGLNKIKKHAERLKELIDELMDLSKLDAGKLVLQVSKGDINQSVKTIASSFDSLTKVKKLTFHVQVNETSVSMFYDLDNLQKVLSNLISNAIKFTPENGTIQVETSVSKDHFIIHIKDDGPGIPEEHQNLIFKRFYQIKQSQLTKYKGTGIGLALTKELVELHHGKLELVSIPNQGSTFIVSLPMDDKYYRKEEIVEASLTIDQPIVSEYSSKRNDDLPVILIVEDNDDLRDHMVSLFDKEYELLEAKNGKEGVFLALKEVPDLIVTDLMMPEMDGMELCSQLKENEVSNHIPIVVLTAKADLDSRLESLLQGVDDYLTKPFELNELKVRVRNLIEQRSLLKERFSSKVVVEPSNVNVTPAREVFIKKAIALVEEHIENTDFNVEVFQQEMGMSRMQLHRKLKALTGYSSSEFIRKLRIQRAAQLLAQDAGNISEIAYQTGFNSLSYFSECFKEHFGVTPSKYSPE